jgi:hypothetical protein
MQTTENSYNTVQVLYTLYRAVELDRRILCYKRTYEQHTTFELCQ